MLNYAWLASTFKAHTWKIIVGSVALAGAFIWVLCKVLSTGKCEKEEHRRRYDDIQEQFKKQSKDLQDLTKQSNETQEMLKKLANDLDKLLTEIRDLKAALEKKQTDELGAAERKAKSQLEAMRPIRELLSVMDVKPLDDTNKTLFRDIVIKFDSLMMDAAANPTPPKSAKKD